MDKFLSKYRIYSSLSLSVFFLSVYPPPSFFPSFLAFPFCLSFFSCLFFSVSNLSLWNTRCLARFLYRTLRKCCPCHANVAKRARASVPTVLPRSGLRVRARADQTARSGELSSAPKKRRPQRVPPFRHFYCPAAVRRTHFFQISRDETHASLVASERARVPILRHLAYQAWHMQRILAQGCA